MGISSVTYLWSDQDEGRVNRQLLIGMERSATKESDEVMKCVQVRDSWGTEAVGTRQAYVLHNSEGASVNMTQRNASESF